jgi:DNA processing protein
MLGADLAERLAQSGGGSVDQEAIETGKEARFEIAAGAGKNAEYRRLWSELGHEPATLDELVHRTGQPAAALSSMLLMLELEAKVETLPGNRYQRLG